jgi:hypothetical protein
MGHFPFLPSKPAQPASPSLTLAAGLAGLPYLPLGPARLAGCAPSLLDPTDLLETETEPGSKFIPE